MTKESFTRLPNNIIEKLSEAELAGADFRIALATIRKTNGWQKDDDWISYSQFEEMTGLTRKSVSKSLARLVNANILLVTKSKLPSYKINPDVDSWVVTKSKLVTKCTPTSYQMVTAVVTKSKPKLVTKWKPTKEKKETITKETNTKEIGNSAKQSYGDPQINEVIDYLQEKIGHKLDGSVKSNRQYAYNLIRKIKSQTDREPIELIKLVIDKGIQDSFHSRNLTGVKYLYNNFGKIGRSKSQGVTVTKIS